jgi:hypothetical protein
MLRTLAGGILWAICLSAPARADVCGPVSFIEPGIDATVGSARPTIRWTPAPGATAYRVRLVSRVPEGGTLVSLDVQTAEAVFTPPKPLGDSLAVVRVTVTPRCGQGPSHAEGREAAYRFFVDTRLSCPAVTGLRFNPAGSSPRLHWAPVESARGYEVLIYATADGRLLERKETREPMATVPPAGNVTSIAAVRPRCAESYGRFAFAAIP